MAKNEAHLVAENKIVKAKFTKQESLNLSDSNIIKLPKGIGQLLELKTLNLSKNKIKELPDFFKELKQLQSLNLSGNQLKVLPDWMSEFTQLQFLDLSDNQISVLPEWIGNLTKIKTLRLSYNQFVTFPESFGRLENLQELESTNNSLISMPVSLGNLTQLQSIDVFSNQITSLPETIGNLAKLQRLTLSNNHLNKLPHTIVKLSSLSHLILTSNNLEGLPDEIDELVKLRVLYANHNQLRSIPERLANIEWLEELYINNNQLIDLPISFKNIKRLQKIKFERNPYNPELSAASAHGLDGIVKYLRAKDSAQVVLNEAKLILIGEGEVGKTCLLSALRDEPFIEGLSSTHGIEIQQIKVLDPTDPELKTVITLNGWDFGGQRVYRPTHQLFFSAPAVYLVVWKPREGSQAGQVKEWIQLVKRREPSAKIFVVATHGGPQQRQPDIDRQELWDLFGKETVVDFFFVDSKPDEQGKRKGIEELKQAIASVAAELPEVGRTVPKSFSDVRQALQEKGVPYLPLHEVLAICRVHNMDNEIAQLFISISHRLGHLTHYENDPTLRDIVILRPDWLATAMSYVLDDEETRDKHGLVNFSRLKYLWDDPLRSTDSRYPESLHHIFLRLMERFDLSYRVADPFARNENDPVSLVGQLVPDVRPPNLADAWGTSYSVGDTQQIQVCRIVDANNGQSANAEGLFYQLIVRLHKYSLGRTDYNASVHWQHGIMLDDNYNGRALLEHIGNDIKITVRAAYPEFFLAILTREIKWLVEESPTGWHGLRCNVMVPCVAPCGKEKPGTNLFEVEKLIAFKRKGLKQFPCTNSGCEALQDIDQLLLNAPAASKPISIEVLERQLSSIENKLDNVDINVRRIRSQADKNFDDLIHLLTDEAKEGPRLFSFFPVDRSNFNPKTWIREKFRLVLWCEHSRLPLPALNGADSKEGVYDLELDREWFKKSAPYLKILTSTLGMVLPVASSAVKLALDEAAYKLIEEQLDFGKSVIDAAIGTSGKVSDFMSKLDSTDLEHGVAVRGDGSTLRELHALLKVKDPGFGGLVRVMNKRQEFLWVHEKYAGEY